MADHVLCSRPTDSILKDLDIVQEPVYDREIEIDMRELLWEIIDTVRDSYALALRGTEQPLTPEQIVEVETTVEDFVSNAFGDD